MIENVDDEKMSSYDIKALSLGSAIDYEEPNVKPTQDPTCDVLKDITKIPFRDFYTLIYRHFRPTVPVQALHVDL